MVLCDCRTQLDWRFQLSFHDSPPKVNLIPDADGEGQRRISVNFLIMLVQDIRQRGVNAEVLLDLVAAVQIDFLIGGIEIAVGQQQGVAEVGVTQEGAVVAAGDEGPHGRHQEAARRPIHSGKSGVGRDAEWPRAYQRRIGSNRNAGEQRIDGGLQARCWKTTAVPRRRYRSSRVRTMSLRFT